MGAQRATNRQVRISKTLSFWLRHNPDAGGLRLDKGGWAPVAEVLAALDRRLDPPVTRAELEQVVATNDKRRFTIRDDRIRAVQGHSIDVALDVQPIEPPAVLYHGTTHERWATIQASGGLSKMRRHHVHLSPDLETAERVAARHRGERPLVLRVDTAAAATAGHPFFITENGVYLTEAVPLAFLTPVEP